MNAVSNLAPSSPKTANPALAAGGAPARAAFSSLLDPAVSTGDDAVAARQDDAATGKDLPDTGDSANPIAWLAPDLVTLPPSMPTPAPVSAPTSDSRPASSAANTPADAITPAAMSVLASDRGNRMMALPSVADRAPIISAPAATTTPPGPPPPAAGAAHVPLEPVIITPPATAPDQAPAQPEASPPRLIVLPPVGPAEPEPAIGKTPAAAAPSPPSAGSVASPAVVLTPAPAQAEPEVARIAPAAQVFAAAIQRAASEDRPATDQAQASLAVFPAGTDNSLHAVTASADPRQTALDMRQDNWPHQMIQRIDALRDAANANDASIRLIPDALGKIDVSLKREGDGVSVHLDAHQPETRQILAEAQPRLTELAEARGLKLSATTGGTSDAGGQPLAQQQQQRASQNAAKNSAPPGAATEADHAADTDERIA
ncbi:flagellar hook-length control protein FliK [Sphingomonas sp. TX0543]|uniref:flagellar hook-length control protein FliK n=1 Tax=unclassified Sphingomonas TaxID=196159 RepID=UPI0010F79192|nr:flagellar hook-length control protein FliK [Sphingomonas sp. 3P27F8]